MAMQLARTATAGVVGAGSGVLGSGILAPLSLGGMTIGYDTILEVVALVGGAVMQFAAPRAAPNVADGLVDGGLALGARRLTVFALKRAGVAPAMFGYGSPYAMGAARIPFAVGAQTGMSYARPAVGGIGISGKRKLT